MNLKTKKTTYKCDCCNKKAEILINEDGEVFEDGGDMYCYIGECDKKQGYYCYDCNPADYRKNKMLKLNSVGSIIDTKTNIVYPQNVDGKPDLNCGVYLAECSNEWYVSLNRTDNKKIMELTEQITK